MRRLFLLSLFGCSVSTSQFAGLTQCDANEDCEPGWVCHSDGVCVASSCDSAFDCPSSTIELDCRQSICQGVGCDELTDCLPGAACEAGFCTYCIPTGEEGPTGDPTCYDGQDNDCDSIVDDAEVDCLPSCNNDSECLGDNPCDGIEYCEGGFCLPGVPVDCTVWDDPSNCLAGVCNPADGSCTQEIAPDGTECDDGLHCTLGETCSLGRCESGEDNLCSEVTDVCNPTATCDEETDSCVAVPIDCGPADSCETPGCDPSLGCNPPASDGTECDDGSYCTLLDSCISGLCEGSGDRCDDGDSCTFDTCDEGSASCVYTVDIRDPVCNPCDTNEACDDGDSCTVDTCDAPACTSTAMVCADDGNPCTDERCDPDLGCVSETNTLVCDDGNACTVDDFCSDGNCSGVEILCDDGDVCNGGETCLGGDCVPGDELVCAEVDDPCVIGGCDPISGCNPPQPDGSSCADGEFCNGDETCQDGTCTAGVSPCESDGIDCTLDDCDEGDDSCTNSPDDSLCTTADERCLPECFSGTGCGSGPSSVSVDCPDVLTLSDGSATASCSVSVAGLPGQAPCLSCSASHGIDVIAFADFTSCSLDGWESTEEDYKCPIDQGPLSGTEAIESEGPNVDVFGTTVVLEQTFDNSAYDHVVLCFDYGDRSADDNPLGPDRFQVTLGNDCENESVINDTAGPSQAAENRFVHFCVPLDEFDDCALGSAVTVQFYMFASYTTEPDEIFLDNVALYGWNEDCVSQDIVFEDPVDCDGSSTCSASDSGWTIEAGTPLCSCSDPGFYRANGGSSSPGARDWTISRTVDVSALSGDVILGFGYDQNDDGDESEGLRVDARATSDSPWKTVFEHDGSLNDHICCTPFLVNLSERLGDALRGSSSLGIRFRVHANGTDDVVRLDRIVVGGATYTCAADNVTLGDFTESGGGSYSMEVTSEAAERVQLTCSWNGEVSGVDIFESRP